METSELTKEYLEYEYLVKRKSATQIARDANINAKTLDYWLNKYGIPRRTTSEAMKLIRNTQRYSKRKYECGKQWRWATCWNKYCGRKFRLRKGLNKLAYRYSLCGECRKRIEEGEFKGDIWISHKSKGGWQ